MAKRRIARLKQQETQKSALLMLRSPSVQLTTIPNAGQAARKGTLHDSLIPLQLWKKLLWHG